MPPPDSKGTNYKSQNFYKNSGTIDGNTNQSLNSHDLIVMTADQCIKE